MFSDYHFVFGLHSKIPLCCVTHFCEQVKAGKRSIAVEQIEKFGLSWPHPESPGYVLCDKCMKEFVAGRRDFPTPHKCSKTDSRCTVIVMQFQEIQKWLQSVISITSENS